MAGPRQMLMLKRHPITIVVPGEKLRVVSERSLRHRNARSRFIEGIDVGQSRFTVTTLPNRFTVEVSRLTDPRQSNKTDLILVKSDVFAEMESVPGLFTAHHRGLRRHVILSYH